MVGRKKSVGIVAVVAVLAWGAGCTPIEHGGFSVRGLNVSPEEDIPTAGGTEIASYWKHSTGFATELAANYWVSTETDSSEIAVQALRVTALYAYDVSDKLALRAGGGFTVIDAQYRPSYESLEYLWNDVSVRSGEVDVSPTLGYHLQAEITYALQGRSTIGAFVRYTKADATASVTGWYDTGGYKIATSDTFKLGSTEIGLTIGMSF